MDRKFLYLFDKDSTLTESVVGNLCPNDPKDQLILPNVMATIQRIKAKGHFIGLVTNQGGVACGFMQEKTAWEIIGTLNFLLGNPFDTVQVNFYHGKGKYKSRYVDKGKPNPRMIAHAIEDIEHMGKEFDRVHFIGDSHTDEKCFLNFQEKYDQDIDFHWAHQFFFWDEDDIEKNDYGYKWKRDRIVAMISGRWNGSENEQSPPLMIAKTGQE